MLALEPEEQGRGTTDTIWFQDTWLLPRICIKQLTFHDYF